jgi:hypothetical protein
MRFKPADGIGASKLCSLSLTAHFGSKRLHELTRDTLPAQGIVDESTRKLYNTVPCVREKDLRDHCPPGIRKPDTACFRLKLHAPLSVFVDRIHGAVLKRFLCGGIIRNSRLCDHLCDAAVKVKDIRRGADAQSAANAGVFVDRYFHFVSPFAVMCLV